MFTTWIKDKKLGGGFNVSEMFTTKDLMIRADVPCRIYTKVSNVKTSI